MLRRPIIFYYVRLAKRAVSDTWAFIQSSLLIDTAILVVTVIVLVGLAPPDEALQLHSLKYPLAAIGILVLGALLINLILAPVRLEQGFRELIIKLSSPDAATSSASSAFVLHAGMRWEDLGRTRSGDSLPYPEGPYCPDHLTLLMFEHNNGHWREVVEYDHLLADENTEVGRVDGGQLVCPDCGRTWPEDRGHYEHLSTIRHEAAVKLDGERRRQTLLNASAN